MEEWLVTKLGSLVSGRIYGGVAPPNTDFPYIVFRQISGVDVPLDADTVKKSDRWEIDSYTSGSYTIGRELLKQIKTALDVTGSDSGLCVISTSVDSGDLYDEKVEMHYQSSDLLIEYTEQ